MLFKGENVSFDIILILITIHRMFSTVLGVEFTKFIKITNVKNSEFFSSQQGLPLSQCLGKCTKHATCESVSFGDDGMKCYFSVGRQCGSSGQGLETVNGWNFYGKHKHTVAAHITVNKFASTLNY